MSCWTIWEIENITALIECTGRLFTAATRHKQRCCDNKIETVGNPKVAQHDKNENVAGSVWLSLFMDGSGNASYRPRPLAPGWAELNIYTCYL